MGRAYICILVAQTPVDPTMTRAQLPMMDYVSTSSQVAQIQAQIILTPDTRVTTGPAPTEDAWTPRRAIRIHQLPLTTALAQPDGNYRQIRAETHALPILTGLHLVYIYWSVVRAQTQPTTRAGRRPNLRQAQHVFSLSMAAPFRWPLSITTPSQTHFPSAPLPYMAAQIRLRLTMHH